MRNRPTRHPAPGATALEQLQPPAPIAAPLLIDPATLGPWRLGRWSTRALFLSPFGLVFLAVLAAGMVAFAWTMQPQLDLIDRLLVASVITVLSLLITAGGVAVGCVAMSRVSWGLRFADPAVRIYATTDAVITVTASKRGTWHVSNHVARLVGVRLGRPLQAQIGGPLSEQQQAAGVDVDATAIVPKLQRHYVDAWGMTRVSRTRFVRFASDGPLHQPNRANSTAASG